MELDTFTADLAAKLAGNWQHIRDFSWFDRPEAVDEKWALVYTSNRDSGLLDQSNAAYIDKQLAPYTEGATPSVIPQTHSHFACGHVDGYAIRVYTPEGSVTPAFKAYAECLARMENYPVLDETDYSQREYDATWHNMEEQVSYYARRHGIIITEDQLQAIWDYLWDSNELESCDDQGGYPSDEAVAAAIESLGVKV